MEDAKENDFKTKFIEFTKNPITSILNSSFKMILIPKREFSMGNSGEGTFRDEKPQNKIIFEQDFYACQYPVTQALWVFIMGENPSFFKGLSHPVDSVDWYECLVFCNRLSEISGRQPAYQINGTDIKCDWSSNGYRLLTEAEWEYIAKEGKVFTVAKSNSEIGQAEPNHFDIYDMFGNVQIWCWDFYKEQVYQSREREEGIINPKGPETGVFRVKRGFGWNENKDNIRVSYRCYATLTDRYSFIGLRVGASH